MVGYKVSIYDSAEENLKKGYHAIQKKLQKMAARLNPGENKETHDKFVGTVLGRLSIEQDIEQVLPESGLVIEAIKEDRDAKCDLFRYLINLKELSKDTILATNTSSFQVGEFAALSKIFSSKFAGLHFFNPVDKMKLVEVVKTDVVAPETIVTLKKFVESLGKP